MGQRRFRDRDGRGWEVRADSKYRWRFEPLRGNDQPQRAARPPGYTDDPFELSEQELQRLLDTAPRSERPGKKPPLFRDEL